MPEAMGDWQTVAAATVFDPNLSFRPTVSVCVLSHRPEFKAQAEASVRAQTLWASGTVEIVSKECPTYWGDKINGVIRGAEGDFIVPLCDDDELAPDALEKMLAVARVLGPELCDFVYSDIWLFDGPDGNRRLELPDWTPAAPSQRCVPWVTALYRRRVFEETLYDRVGYDPRLQYWDWDWARRLGKAGKKGVRIPEPLFHAREHAENGHKQMNHGHAFVQMYVKHDELEGPKPRVPEFVYPPYYEGRPSVLTEAELAKCG